MDSSINSTSVNISVDLIVRELSKLDRVEDRLKYWYENIYLNIVGEVDSVELSTLERHEALRDRFFDLFKEVNTFNTDLYIPQPIFKELYEPFVETKEYDYWFFLNEGERRLKNKIRFEKWEQKLSSPLRKEIISGVLAQMQVSREKSFKLLSSGDIKNLESSINNIQNEESQLQNEVQFLRLINEYYKTNEFENREQALDIYVEKVLFYDWLRTFEEDAYRKDVFINLKSQQWFEFVINESSLFVGGLEKHGSKAKLSAIFHDGDCKKIIFIKDLTLKGYIEYLNEVWSVGIPYTTKLSDPSIHSGKVAKLIKEYKMQSNPNKPE